MASNSVGRCWKALVLSVSSRFFLPLRAPHSPNQADVLARSLIPTFPPMKPHQSAEAHLKPLESILTRHDPQCLTKYSTYIQQARYAEREPSVGEYEMCMGLHVQMRQL